VFDFAFFAFGWRIKPLKRIDDEMRLRFCNGQEEE
jgi:hypothetical protein